MIESAMLAIQHRLNPLHIYCRLRDRGINKRISMRVSWCYEIAIYQWVNPLTVLSLSCLRTTKRHLSKCGFDRKNPVFPNRSN